MDDKTLKTLTQYWDIIFINAYKLVVLEWLTVNNVWNLREFSSNFLSYSSSLDEYSWTCFVCASIFVLHPFNSRFTSPIWSLYFFIPCRIRLMRFLNTMFDWGCTCCALSNPPIDTTEPVPMLSIQLFIQFIQFSDFRFKLLTYFNNVHILD